jgi:hypothetical protein
MANRTSYAGTIVSRRTNEGPKQNLPGGVFLTPEIISRVWEPLPIPRIQFAEAYLSKKLSDIVKASAMHIKEGHVYEAKAAVWNNPMRPVEISGWGELNNIGGARVPTKANLATKRPSFRDIALQKSLKAEIDRCSIVIEQKCGPEPDPSDKTRYSAWKSKVYKWENDNPENARPDVGLSTKGHAFLPLIFKTNSYFVAPKFSSVELRGTPMFKMGKGASYIELDGLIHINLPGGKHRFLLIELKKEKGTTGPEDAQQLRKAAALLRKWCYELTGTLPVIELYFAAGATNSFVTAGNGYSFNSEKANVQNWAPRKIREAIRSSPKHVAYIRTPIMLLTAKGFADLLRIDPWRMAKIKSGLTEASSSIGVIAKYLRNKSYQDFFSTEPEDNYLLIKTGAKTFKPPDIEEVVGKEQLYLNLVKLFQNNKNNFRKNIPTYWHPNKVKELAPTMALARVSEGLLYVNALKRKLNNPNKYTNRPAKLAELERNYIKHVKYLLTNKYSRYISNSAKFRLQMQLARFPNTMNVNNNKSPTNNKLKYYKRVLKQATIGGREYYKPPKLRLTGNSRANALAIFKANKPGAGKYKIANRSRTTGAQKIRVGHIIGEYNLEKRAKPAVNFGDNLTSADIANVNNSTLSRWINMISKRIRPNAPNLPNADLNKFKIILNGAVSSRNIPATGTTPQKYRKKRLELAEYAKLVKNSLEIKRQTRRPVGTAKGQKRAKTAPSAPTRVSSRPAKPVKYNSGANN